MKKIIMFLSIVFMVSLFSITAFANDDIAIYVDGIKLQCDKAPYIDNGRTMVPMRKIFESLDATVDWIGETQTIIAKKDDTEIVLQIGDLTLYKNDVAESLDVAPIIKGGTTFVPARAVAQALGTNVEWIGDISTVNITSPGVETLSEYPNILLPQWGNVEAVDDPYESGFAYAFPTGQDEIISKDTPVPSDIENLMINWIEKLEDVGWQKNKVEPEYDFQVQFMKYDFAENINEDTMYGFTITLGVSTVDYCTSFGLRIEPYDYRIVYKNTGEFKKVRFDDVDNYTQYGEWRLSDTDKITIYDSNNNTLRLYEYEAVSYLTSGWSTEPHMVTMYAADGRTITIESQHVEAYKNVGWYTEPVIIMYAADGRTRYVIMSEVEAYERVGWYTYPPYVDNSSDESTTQQVSTVYVAKSGNGKRYHYKSTCIKNGKRININDAKRLGYTPCSKCAR